ncbi:hypothetical protein BJ741DRAFT_586233 [Chytriomyces cf. hyalinus JEL632]|nr:hypothetical protein BJ741DRAFT_586233 [Chytriomyces cf. hyalinus JEL632]
MEVELSHASKDADKQADKLSLQLTAHTDALFAQWLTKTHSRCSVDVSHAEGALKLRSSMAAAVVALDSASCEEVVAQADDLLHGADSQASAEIASTILQPIQLDLEPNSSDSQIVEMKPVSRTPSPLPLHTHRKDSGIQLVTTTKMDDIKFYFPLGNPLSTANSLYFPSSEDSSAARVKTHREALTILSRKSRSRSSSSSCVVATFFPDTICSDEETNAKTLDNHALDPFDALPATDADLNDDFAISGKVIPQRKPLHLALDALKTCFQSAESLELQSLSKNDMWPVMDALGLPRYCSFALFDKILGIKRKGAADPASIESMDSVEYHDVKRWWVELNETFHDEYATVFKIMMGSVSTNPFNYLTPQDFYPVVDEVVKKHPGLAFLTHLAVFQAKYIETVITRIFFTKIHCYLERMTLPEFRKHAFLDLIIKLQIDDDINATRDAFSYKHFYVIYCKFWELDTAHTMRIEASSMARYDGRALTTFMMDRVVSGCGKPLSLGSKSGAISYTDFVWFMLCVEDKRTDASIDYWFRCLDLDGDGKLSLHELREFYNQQVERMLECRMSEPWRFDDFVCSLLDLVQPKNIHYITPRDLKRARHNAPLFFDMIFDLRKYDTHVRRIDPMFREMDDVVVDDVQLGRRVKLEGWDKFAERSYDQLAYEENSSNSLHYSAGDAQGDAYAVAADEHSSGDYSDEDEYEDDEDEEMFGEIPGEEMEEQTETSSGVAGGGGSLTGWSMDPLEEDFEEDGQEDATEEETDDKSPNAVHSMIGKKFRYLGVDDDDERGVGEQSHEGNGSDGVEHVSEAIRRSRGDGVVQSIRL